MGGCWLAQRCIGRARYIRMIRIIILITASVNLALKGSAPRRFSFSITALEMTRKHNNEFNAFAS
jgi:hypothetical protein